VAGVVVWLGWLCGWGGCVVGMVGSGSGWVVG
jgi:hypothetical protein